MIVVTGGAGFIGSAIIWQLNKRGRQDILVVDHLGESEKWRNLVPLTMLDYLDRTEFIEKLESGEFNGQIEAIFHMGACSATTERNADYLMENNYRYTTRLASWALTNRDCRFIYASSAATYGNGERGYDDEEKLLPTLRPLNMYGYSKHLFDLLALRNGWLKKMVGLKFFNVFGPNEGHKGDMRSVINKAWPEVRGQGTMKLFQSHREQYGHGEQKRDFLYVKDAVAMTLFFFDNPDVNGIFNIGTGQARSWNDVARAMFASANKTPEIRYVPMPEHLKGKYQYYTCAEMRKIREAGCTHRCMSLEDAIDDYIRNYLRTDSSLDPLKD
ncbi:MAG: ADP-glyceromanno-heptose 6-epimerase [Chitinispirillaceae bacterium]